MRTNLFVSFPRTLHADHRLIAAALGLLAGPAGLGQSAPVSPPAAAPTVALEPMTITGTREKALLIETPASIAAISAEAIRDTAPLHPGQLLGQVPGVAVAVTNGEGHTTAIRQPFTTSPVYLFLEDGIPTRATGFFNHNALYEVNIPMAGGIEVVRGPGTALHGSDAIGGIVNILSRAPSPARNASLSAEHGRFGTWRVMAGGGSAVAGRGAYRADLNLTHSDGWRDQTAYDRRSLNVRLDQPVGANGTIKAIVGLSKIQQETGANSALTFGDYLNNPTRNNLSIAFRHVTAARVSVEYEQQFGTGMLSLTPYFRDNSMELNGTFNLSSGPRLEETKNVSYGFLAKWRKNLPVMRARIIGGVDLDYSPGSRREDNLLVTRSGTGANTVFLDYRVGTRTYDYDVTFRSASPYLHAEASVTPAIRVTAGVRYDALQFDMENRLPAGTVQASVLGATRFYGQLADDRSRFSRVTPKIGATFALAKHAHLFASFNQGFRAPSEGQIYRAGNDANAVNALARSQLALGLKPIKAEQFEVGLRGTFASVSYDVVVYDLSKRDDLVSQRDLATNVSTNVNAGKTGHKGFEAGLGFSFTRQLRLDAAFSYARHRYVNWVTATANFSGRNIEAAPRVMANTRLTWRPVTGAMAELEWIRIGSYWLEASNSPTFGKYPGHDLVNVRASYAFNRNWSVFARIINAANKRFADSASVSSSTPVFSPGLPRAFHGGIETRW
jgi:outer membrane receptor protein involved in Fe transport